MARKGWERIVVPVALRLALGDGSGTGGIVDQQPARITAVSVDPDANTYVIAYSDGSAVHGSATFDDDGNPTALSDDAGNEVVFSLGNPIGAKDAEGNVVDITVGGA